MLRRRQQLQQRLTVVVVSMEVARVILWRRRLALMSSCHHVLMCWDSMTTFTIPQGQGQGLLWQQPLIRQRLQRRILQHSSAFPVVVALTLWPAVPLVLPKVHKDQQQQQQ
jgi:hypothetical protein